MKSKQENIMKDKFNEPLMFLEHFCDFSNPNWVWILTGIARNKENDESNSFLKRFIIKSKEDIETYYNFLKELMDKQGFKYRIYISLNARDTVKTLFNYQKKLMDISYDISRGVENNNVGKLDSLWKTELAQMNNRGTKRFFFDIDGDYDYQEICDFAYENIPIDNLIAFRKTPNGYAVVFDACDVRDALQDAKKKKIDLTLHKDSMVFIEKIE